MQDDQANQKSTEAAATPKSNRLSVWIAAAFVFVLFFAVVWHVNSNVMALQSRVANIETSLLATSQVARDIIVNNYTQSKKISQFGLPSNKIPALVINCDKIRVGVFSAAENFNGIPPLGTEKQDLFNQLCIATSDNGICSNYKETALEQNFTKTNFPACDDGRIQVYSFLSPNDVYSIAEKPIIDSLKTELPQVDLVRVCYPFSEADKADCGRMIALGQFDE